MHEKYKILDLTVHLGTKDHNCPECGKSFSHQRNTGKACLKCAWEIRKLAYQNFSKMSQVHEQIQYRG